MEKETLRKFSFWTGIILILIPIVALVVDNLWMDYGVRIGDPSDLLDPNYRTGLKSNSFDDYFYSIRFNDSLPYVLLFVVGSASILFSIYENNPNAIKRSKFSVILGGVVWLYLIINIIVGGWWWLTWILLALSGIGLLVFGFRNLTK
ncbi:MAG: hypothetical protein IKP54_00510 [Bacteroidales bacterium]|nr:hypothetical protein [Bacteroidales bacterium]